MNEDLERLRQAFPGMVWTALDFYYVGGSEPHEDGDAEEIDEPWLIFVGRKLDTADVRGPAAAFGRHILGPDPIADLGRVITDEGERITKEAAALGATGALLRFAAVGVPF